MRRHFSCFSRYLWCCCRETATATPPEEPTLQDVLYDSDDEDAPPSSFFTMKNTTPFTPPVKDGIVIHIHKRIVTIASTLPYPNSPTYRFPIYLRKINVSQEKNPSLEKLIMNKYVTLHNARTDNYGRIIADLYVRNIHINQWLLDNRHATMSKRKHSNTSLSSNNSV